LIPLRHRELKSGFLSGKEVALETLCQKGDRKAIVYAGYHAENNELRFWPEDERAQVVYLAGFAALIGNQNELAALHDFLR
jgi:hypothetical protein